MRSSGLAGQQRLHFHNNIGSFVVPDWAGCNYDTWKRIGCHIPFPEKLLAVTMCSGMLSFAPCRRRVEKLVVVVPPRAVFRDSKCETTQICAEALANEMR